MFLLRSVLWLLSFGYKVIVRVRNRFYDNGKCTVKTVTVPVISVGNLTTGGTGKTPIVAWLCQFLQDRAVQTAVLTRGYGTERGQMTDELAILGKSCPETAIVVDADRTAGAETAIKKHNAQVLVMDDGFQHRRLGRDLDIVAVDATNPFGYDRFLPAGLLREPKESLKRADAVIITRSNQVSRDALEKLTGQIKQFNSHIPVVFSVHKPTFAESFKKQRIELSELDGKKVFAFCGIGNPQAFFNSLGQNGMEVVDTFIFDDHHKFTKQDIEQLFFQAKHADAEMILCTQKDWVKTALLIEEGSEPICFAYLAMELDFLSGYDKIIGLIDTAMTGQPSYQPKT